MVDKALFSSDSAEWETPQELFDMLNAEFNFDVDVCAEANNTKCKNYFDFLDDGLLSDWSEFEACWCNPPYGKEIGLWIEKAVKESANDTVVVMLLPARTDTKYFHNYIWDHEKHQTRPGVELRFIKGRLKFGGAANSAPFPSMVVIFRPNNDDMLG